jgi:hypothetical protein
MLKKTITYNDFDGNERTEDFYFNLTKAEVTEMEFSFNGGFTKMIEKIVSTKDTKRIIEVFKEMIVKSYGEKSPDGRRFMKSKEILENFTQTEAYSKLYMELATDTAAATAFVNGIIPQVEKTKTTLLHEGPPTPKGFQEPYNVLNDRERNNGSPTSGYKV